MTDELVADAASELVWLLGHPVGHSLSSVMHNAAFQHQGVALRYIARDIPPEGLAAAVAETRASQVRGANLTLPHKEAVLAMLDSVDDEAARIGAVNTIVNSDGILSGHNTDLGGFLASLRVAMPQGATGRECIVLGAGGAARAVVAGLQRDRAAHIWVANRSLDRAVRLCADAESWGQAKCDPLSLKDAVTVALACDLIVNATSLGLPHSVKDLPIDVDILSSGQVLVDLAYGAGPTPLIAAARKRGLLTVDGKEMLVQQAALSYRMWTGMTAPLDVMRGSISGS